MAYNSNKGKQQSGDIQYESDPTDTQIDFENDFVAIKTNAQQRFIVSGSFITSSIPLSCSVGVSGGSFTGDSLAIGGSTVLTVARQLSNIASLDATTETTIEGAIDTLANLGSMGTADAELEAVGSLDVAQGLKINNANFVDASRNITGSGLLTNLAGVKLDTNAVIGTAGDTDLLTLANNQLTVAGTVSASTDLLVSRNITANDSKFGVSAGAITGSGLLTGLGGIKIDTNGVIGTAGDTDLLTLANNQLTVAGTVSASNDLFVSRNITANDSKFGVSAGAITGSGLLTGLGGIKIDTNGVIGTAGDTNLLTLKNNELVVAGDVSGSGEATFAGFDMFINGIKKGHLSHGQVSASLGVTGSSLGTATTVIDPTHVSSSLNISGSKFYGDGSTLTGVGAGTMSSWTLSADGGSSQGIEDGNTVDIAGGTGITTAASATDTVTVNLDDTTVSAGSYTYSAITVDAQGRLTAASSGAPPPITTYSNAADNRVVTSVNSTSVQGEAGLTYNGSILAATGEISASLGVTGSSVRTATTVIDATHVSSSLNISGSKFYGDGSKLSGIVAGIGFNGSTANGLVTYGNSDTADVESNLTFDGNTLTATNASNTAIPAITIDRNYTGTTSIGNLTTDPQGLLVDYDVTGIVASGQTAVHDAIAINFNQDSPTMVGTVYSTGLDCRMTGGTSGEQTMKGIAVRLAGADTNIGLDVEVPDGQDHVMLRSSADTGDYFAISTTTHGATTIKTVDDNATAAHLTCSVDGNIVLDPAGSNVIVDGNLSASLNISASAFYVESQIVHTGDPDTFITFTADDINFQAGGVNFLDLTEDTQNEVTFNEGGVDIDFRVESADESHMLFIEGSSNRMSIGDSTDGPAGTLEITNASDGGVPVLVINNNDTDKRAVEINAANVDANVLHITADAVTTAKVINISADALTTGNAVKVNDDSPNTGTRQTALIVQNNAAAIAATALHVQSDGGITGVELDKNYSGAADATITALNIDFDKTATTTSNNTMYGINIDMDNTTATNGNNYMYGLHVTPTLTHAADAGGAFLYGAFINAQGGTNGSSLVQGARIEAGGGDVNYGLQLDVEDGGVDLRIESSADSGDYFQIQTTTHGATTITTVDDDATAADLTFNVDGDINLTPASGEVLVTGKMVVENSTSPIIEALNNANNAYGAVINLNNTRAGNAGQADDFCGGVTFIGKDSTSAVTQYGKITTKIGSPTNTSEAGYMLFETTTGGTSATEYLRMDGRTNAMTASVNTKIEASTHLSGAHRAAYQYATDSLAASNPSFSVSTGSNVVIFNATGSHTVVLPAINSEIDGIQYYIKNIGSGVVTVTGSHGPDQRIDGQLTLACSQGDSARVIAHRIGGGYGWAVLSYYNV